MSILRLLISFCSCSLSFCPQGLTGGASAMVRWQSNRCVLWLSFIGCCVLCHVGMTNAPVTSYVCSLYHKCAQVSLSETCTNVHPSCTKMCNGSALHIFVQLGCTQYEIHEFLRTHVQHKTLAQKCTTQNRCTCTNVHGTCTNVHGTCTQTCTVLYQATYGDFFGI